MKSMRYYWDGTKNVEIGQYSDNGWERKNPKSLQQKETFSLSDNAESFRRLVHWNGNKTISSLKLSVIDAADKIIATYESNLNIIGEPPSGALAKDERRYENTIYEIYLPRNGEYKLEFEIIWDENANDGSAIIHNKGVYVCYIYRQVLLPEKYRGKENAMCEWVVTEVTESE